MPKKSKQSKKKKIPYDDTQTVIYGILHLTTNKLVKVDLDQKAIWFEYDMSMYDESQYKIVQFNILLF